MKKKFNECESDVNNDNISFSLIWNICLPTHFFEKYFSHWNLFLQIFRLFRHIWIFWDFLKNGSNNNNNFFGNKGWFCGSIRVFSKSSKSLLVQWVAFDNIHQQKKGFGFDPWSYINCLGYVRSSFEKPNFKYPNLYKVEFYAFNYKANGRKQQNKF